MQPLQGRVHQDDQPSSMTPLAAKTVTLRPPPLVLPSNSHSSTLGQSHYYSLSLLRSPSCFLLATMSPPFLSFFLSEFPRVSVVKAKSRIYEKVKKGGKITLVRLMFRVQRGHFLSIFFFSAPMCI